MESAIQFSVIFSGRLLRNQTGCDSCMSKTHRTLIEKQLQSIEQVLVFHSIVALLKQKLYRLYTKFARVVVLDML